MASFLIGIFIGLAVGVSFGLIIYSMNLGSSKVYRKLVEDQEKEKETRRSIDPCEFTSTYICLNCNHKWREYSRINRPPQYCPNCGAPLEEEEKEDAVAASVS